MEAFGRMIALVAGIIGVVFLLFFSKTAVARWQRHETIRSMSHAFAENVLWNKKISCNEWEAFRKTLEQIGGYRAELTVYEGRRFEDKNGGFYLYEKKEIIDDKVLREGSYVRILVFRDENRADERLLAGDYGAIAVGGRVQ